jgi:hypothetical protein
MQDQVLLLLLTTTALTAVVHQRTKFAWRSSLREVQRKICAWQMAAAGKAASSNAASLAEKVAIKTILVSETIFLRVKVMPSLTTLVFFIYFGTRTNCPCRKCLRFSGSTDIKA